MAVFCVSLSSSSASLLRPLRKQPYVPVKLRRLALELDDARTADPTTLGLAIPQHDVRATLELYQGEIRPHHQVTGAAV